MTDDDPIRLVFGAKLNAIVRTTSRDLTQYDPVRGLQEIVVAEAAERHWSRAKDVVQLMVAIEAKIRGQADYVVWRDSVVPPTGFKDGKRFRSETLPAADPGRLTVHRWRKAFCKTVDDLDDDGAPRKTTICQSASKFDPRLDCAPGAGQVEVSDLTG
jgi:hypothetical protein